jgi:RimJ/RimL family protein N-acetyltransferase
MTTVDDPSRTSQREVHRRELAELIELDAVRLQDGARFAEDLRLDSLAMMCVRTWLETEGVTIGGERDLPPTVGGVLSLLGQVAAPGLSIEVRSGTATGTAAGLFPPVGPARTAPSLAPVMATPALRLTLIEQQDIGFLYALAAHPETGFRWRYRGSPPPFERFTAELWSQVLVQYVVRRVDDDQPVGHVVAYAATPGLRHAYVGAVFDPRHTGTGAAAHAVTLFLRYLFHTFGMVKLYMEVPGFNWPQIRSGEGRLFTVEGVLKDHDYYAGRSWDSYLLAVYPEQANLDPTGGDDPADEPTGSH